MNPKKPERVFINLNGQTYPNQNVFMLTLPEQFREHKSDFPFGYSYKDLLSWGEHEGWIKRKHTGEVSINYNDEQQ